MNFKREETMTYTITGTIAGKQYSFASPCLSKAVARWAELKDVARNNFEFRSSTNLRSILSF